jgi:hypothetical protein
MAAHVFAVGYALHGFYEAVAHRPEFTAPMNNPG